MRGKRGREAKADHLKEMVGGITTFFTMSYIVVVNPSILATEGTGMSFNGVLTATVLLCFLMTLLMGVYAKLPYAVAPGMGINAFFTYTIILGEQVPWPTALGMVFWSGVLFLLISLFPIREKIAIAIPDTLRIAVATGIGMFLTFIGLKNAGMIVSDPATFVKMGVLNGQSLLTLLGMALMLYLYIRRSAFAFLGGIFVITLGSLALGWIRLPSSLFSRPDFTSVFFQLDYWGALRLSAAPTILSILFTDLFDSLSTFIGVSHATGLVDKQGQPQNLRQGLIVDAWATLGAGVLGTSSGTAYIESAAGIEAGGRTGWTAIYASLCFLPCLFIAPLASIVPEYATAPVLIFVGALLFRSIAHLPLQRIEDYFPAFVTIVLIPLTFSITQGILWGFISYISVMVLVRKRKQISSILWGIGGLSVFLLFIEHFYKMG